jgi:hypothetical protein
MKIAHKKIKTLLLIFLICSLTSVFQQLNNVHAQTATTPADKERAFITDVLEIDLSKYNVITQRDSINAAPFNVSTPFIIEGGYYNLTSNSSKLEITFMFANGFFYICFLNFVEGSPLYIQQPPSNNFDFTKSFMQKYQSYISQYWDVDVSHLQLANNLISTAPKTDNLTLTKGNVKFETHPTSSQPGCSLFSWTYTQNGVDVSRKHVSLNFMNRSLQNIYDGWSLYSVATTNHIPQDQAVSLALPAAENFALKFTQRNTIYGPDKTVIGHNETELVVMPDLTNATIQAHFDMNQKDKSATLYPIWFITFNFYKPIYDVLGITVTLWGDTGQIVHCQANVHLGPSSPEDPSNPAVTLNTSTIPTDTQPSPTPTPNTSATSINIDLTVGIAIAVAIAIAATIVILKRRSK